MQKKMFTDNAKNDIGKNATEMLNISVTNSNDLLINISYRTIF